MQKLFAYGNLENLLTPVYINLGNLHPLKIPYFYLKKHLKNY